MLHRECPYIFFASHGVPYFFFSSQGSTIFLFCNTRLWRGTLSLSLFFFFFFANIRGSIIFFCNSRRRANFLHLQIYEFLQTEPIRAWSYPARTHLLTSYFVQKLLIPQEENKTNSTVHRTVTVLIYTN